MSISGTLLKITDYPFTYSIGFAVIGILGYDVSNEKALPFLILAGIGATLLVILDPFGWLVRNYFMMFARQDFRRKKTGQIGGEWNYIHSAFYTNAIDLEKDKIVSIVYFIIIIFFFLFALNYDSFAKKLVIENNVINCDLNFVRTYLWTSLVVIALIVVSKLIWNGMKLSKKANIVATYLFSVGSSDVPKESVESISKFIELGDWKTAEYWQDKIAEDKKYKRGKRDVVIKSAETVYKPLIAEFTRIKITIDNTHFQKIYLAINFGAWSAIKTNLIHFIIDDAHFRERMDNFENKTSQHDILIEDNSKKIVNTINQVASKIYDKKKVTNIEYFVGGKDGSTVINLVTCALCNIHPRDYDTKQKPYSVNLEWIENKVQRREIMDSQEAIEKFHLGWDDIKSEVENDPNYKKMKNLFEEIKRENLELLKISTERFELQYKV